MVFLFGLTLQHLTTLNYLENILQLHDIVRVAVACVHLNKFDEEAYRCAFEAIFGEVTKHTKGFDVGKTLNGIIADRSNPHLKRLELAIGKELADKVIKGCQLYPVPGPLSTISKRSR
uniref:Uncharacterized protein n=1 Tax=Amphimedon queenslandica TaxID=400682 RepID=A0A1X7T411_AMPQE